MNISGFKPNIITFHLEALENEEEVQNMIKYIKENGIKVGISIKPNTKVEEIYKQYPLAKEKEKILYVPTFRKDKKVPINELIKQFDNDRYYLIIKLHPLDETKVDGKFLVDSKYQTQDLIKIADYVITDYSAVAFEAAVLEKNLFFYLYDIEDYKEDRGVNINLKAELQHSTFFDIKDLKEAIESKEYQYEDLRKFKEKYVETADTKNAHRIANYIIANLKQL